MSERPLPGNLFGTASDWSWPVGARGAPLPATDSSRTLRRSLRMAGMEHANRCDLETDAPNSSAAPSQRAGHGSEDSYP
jgi:hypothetical protein